MALHKLVELTGNFTGLGGHMFESAALGRKCADKEYEAAMQQLRLRLFEAQRQCLTRKIPVLITIAGLNGAGRGAVANLLSEEE